MSKTYSLLSYNYSFCTSSPGSFSCYVVWWFPCPEDISGPLEIHLPRIYFLAGLNPSSSSSNNEALNINTYNACTYQSKVGKLGRFQVFRMAFLASGFHSTHLEIRLQKLTWKTEDPLKAISGGEVAETAMSESRWKVKTAHHELALAHMLNATQGIPGKLAQTWHELRLYCRSFLVFTQDLLPFQESLDMEWMIFVPISRWLSWHKP